MSSLHVNALAAALCAASLSACGKAPSPSASETSILLVTFDTTRADRIGCYGRADAGTPTLDGLAARGARFARAYAPVPITLPSHASLLTGSYPPRHGVRDNGLFVLGDPMETLAETCQRAGYRTAAFISAFPLFRMFGLSQGFELYDDSFQPTVANAPGYMMERPAQETTRAAIEWLATLDEDEVFFAWVHYFDPHDPLQAPEPFRSRFASDPYQAEIAYTDASLGELLSELERLGRTAGTIVAVTADHGESLGDHREEKHAILLYDSTVHVPLILSGPGIPVGVHRAAVSLVDVAPTLLELAGIPGGEAYLAHGGRSLADTLEGGPGAGARDIYLETYYPRLHHRWSELVGIARDGWKYVEAPGERDAAGRPRGELYRPAEDPGETRDLAARETELVAELSQRLDRMRKRMEAESLAAERRALGQDDLDHLAALGYGGIDVLAPELSSSAPPEPGRDPRAVVEATAYQNLVRSLALAGRLAEAQEALDELGRIDPGGVGFHEASGDLNLARGRAGDARAYEHAVGDLARAAELTPGRRGLWARKAEALQALGRYREALESLEMAISLAPPTPALLQAREALERAVAGS